MSALVHRNAAEAAQESAQRLSLVHLHRHHLLIQLLNQEHALSLHQDLLEHALSDAARILSVLVSRNVAETAQESAQHL